MDEEEYQKIYKNIEKEKGYIIERGELFKEKDNQKLRVVRRYELEALMHMMHDNPLSEHFGVKATYDRIKDKYYWKEILKDIEIYVRSCNSCQRRGKPQGKNELHPIEAGNHSKE
jgi:hypothetical protein